MNPEQEISWVACDFETTGIHPAYHHRIVEIGLVYGIGREIQGEWTTTINPERDVTASAIHGLRGGDVVNSPTFGQIAGSVLEIFEGRVPIAHNASFDRGFFESELSRSGIAGPEVEWFCTLRAMSSLGFHPTNLEACCTACGITLGQAHTALADAKACAELVAYEYENFEPAMAQLAPFVYSGSVQSTAAPRPRGNAPGPPKRTLTEIRLELSGSSSVDQAAVQSYAQLLARVLEDRRVTDEEHAALLTCASELNLSREIVESIHGSYLATLNARFMRDGYLSDAERRDLEAVESLLGISAASVAGSQVTNSMSTVELAAGMSVCFTGELESTIGGVAISRTQAQQLAEEAGLVCKSGVSKKLDLLVTVDPDSLSGKARKARELGVRIISEQAFLDALEVETD